MKKIYVAIALVSGSTLASNAAVLTVNNNTPSPGQYTSIPTAIAAAASGDTLYISGSPYNYNSFTITKPLTIIGTGWAPRNTNPSVSTVDDIDFSTSAVSGTKIIGLDIYQLNFNQTTISNVLVQRNKLRYRIIWTASIDNLTFDGNWFEYTGQNIEGGNNGANFTNLFIHNNVFNGKLQNFYSYYSYYNNYVTNNLFLGSGSSYAFNGVYSVVFNNNIFYGASANSSTTSCSFSNNISYSTPNDGFPNGVNQAGVNPLFVSAAVGYYSVANDYALQGGSPANDAGTDGTDIGLSGGDGYFESHGIPPIPQIRDFKITSPGNATINPGGTLQVNVISTIRR